MESLAVWLALTCLILVAVWWGRRRSRRAARPPVSGLDPDDIAELDALARRIHREEASHGALMRHLRLIESRGVPVRRVDPTAWPQRWYLGFADGTAIVIGAENVVAILRLRVALTRAGTLRVARVRQTAQGFWLDLAEGRVQHRVLAVADA